MAFQIGQQVRTIVQVSKDLPYGTVGTVLQIVEEFGGYHVDFGEYEQWNVYENELEAMESE